MDVALPCCRPPLFGVFQFGLHALLVITLLPYFACVVSEYVFESKPRGPQPSSDFQCRCKSGMILALNCPSEIPLWIPILGGVFAIVIVKQIYGGLGQNFMNPALAARCFLLISFAGKMSSLHSGWRKSTAYSL